LTYEYVKPSKALQLFQLSKYNWAHGLILGGPLQRHQLRRVNLDEWLNLNSTELKRQLDLTPSDQRDAEYGLILVMTTFTTPAYADVRFMNGQDTFGPVVMGSVAVSAEQTKWLRGYPVNTTPDSIFEGEIHISDAQEVDNHGCV